MTAAQTFLIENNYSRDLAPEARVSVEEDRYSQLNALRK